MQWWSEWPRQYIDLPAIRRVTAIWIFLLLATASAASAQTDTVTTATGETIIGEIVSIEKDVLTISTPYSDADFKVKWDQVVAIDSPRQFLVETFDGGGCRARWRTARGQAVQVGAVTIGLGEVSLLLPFERTCSGRGSRRASTSATA